MAQDVIVIGAGAVGLSIARRLARERKVLLIDRGSPAREASWAAAGMLCPHAETGEDGPFLRLSIASLGMYRSLAAELVEETGIDVGYLDDGTLLLAATPGEWKSLRSRAVWLREAGLDTEPLAPVEVSAFEPGVTARSYGGLYCPSAHQVRPRALLGALRASCRVRGVAFREGLEVDAVRVEAGRVVGVEARGERLAAPEVVVAAGAWASQIEGLRPTVEVRPRKGQILSLGMPERAFRHVIRGEGVYLVPRSDGELVVGATDEDCGFDRSLTAGGIASLLEGARRLAAGIADLPLRETWTGLRPMTGDGLPRIGPGAVAGLHFALGHYRNGILLAPVTADIMARTLLHGETRSWREIFWPARQSAEPRGRSRSAS